MMVIDTIITYIYTYIYIYDIYIYHYLLIYTNHIPIGDILYPP